MIVPPRKKAQIMYKGLHAALVALFLLACPGHSHNTFASSRGASIHIAEVEASPGDVVDVPVTVSGFQGVHVLQLRINYNSDVLTGIAIDNLHSSIAGAVTNPDSIPMNLNWFNNMIGLDIPDGTKLFDLRFEFCQDDANCIPHNFYGEVFFLEDESYITGPPPTYNLIPLEFYNGAVFDPHADTSTLTIHIAGEGQVMINGDVYSEPYVTNTGNTLNLEAQPGQNWEFESWSGDLSGNDPLQNITMDQDKEVTATFTPAAPEEYTITLIANPETGGTVQDLTDNAPYNVGDQVLIKAEPGTGWEFINWTGKYADNLANDQAAETSLTMPADDVELTANFEIIEFIVTFIIDDEEGDPVEGALVNIDNEFTGFTDENGEVDFIFVTGSYNYEVEMECLISASGMIEVVDEDLEVMVALERLMGDANDDGFVNVLDILVIANYFAMADPLPDPFCFQNADMNGDGIINLIDLLLVANLFSGK